MKKKVLVLVTAVTAVVLSAKAEVEFAYEAGFEAVSAYIWRGQYNGGLSFQPEALVGFDAEDSKIQFRAGVWGNIGASDWKFVSGKNSYIDLETGDEINPNTRFMPELDVMISASAYGASVGLTHYYYCDGSNFFSWKDVNRNITDGNTSTTEIWVGYNFEPLLGVGAYINWYTTIAGNDYVAPTADDLAHLLLGHRAYSSYLELGYDYTFENLGLTLGAQVGMSPWESPLYGNEKFAVTNISLKLNKEWELDVVTLDLFAQGSLNPTDVNKENAYINGSGDEKLYNQKLNGVIGLGVWF